MGVPPHHGHQHDQRPDPVGCSRRFAVSLNRPGFAPSKRRAIGIVERAWRAHIRTALWTNFTPRPPSTYHGTMQVLLAGQGRVV